MNERNTVLLSEPMDSSGTEILEKKCRLIYAESPDDFLERICEANAVILVRNGKVPKEAIEKAHNLKVIAKHGVGLDMIDLPAAKEKGIKVTYTPDSNSISVSEHFVTLCLMLAKKIHKGDLLIRKGKWKTDPFDFLGTELYGKTVGIMGFGRIGQHIARICRNGFNMNVLYYDIIKKTETAKEYDAEWVNVDQLFSESDFISINLPLTSETRGIINGRLLNKMKNSACLVNVGRGALVQEKDLFQALKEGRPAGAASDVFETEPTPEDNPLFGLDNFIGTPHLAAHTEESMRRTSLMIAEDILAVFEGRSPRYPIPDELYH